MQPNNCIEIVVPTTSRGITQIGNYCYNNSLTLGLGSNSQVFSGKDAQGKNVAVKKVSLASLDLDAEFKTILKNNVIKQATLQKTFHNSHIMKVLDMYDTHSEEFYIIYELCYGSLASYLHDREPFKEHDIRIILNQLNYGLHDLRRKNLFHQNIKPTSIYYQKRDHTYPLFKLGNIHNSSSQAEGFAFIGTDPYSPPEGSSPDCDNSKGDLWSLGLLIFFMIFKQHYKLQNKSIESFSLPNDYSNDLHDLLKGLLRIDPKERIEWSEYFIHPFFHPSTRIYATIQTQKENINLLKEKLHSKENIIQKLSKEIEKKVLVFEEVEYKQQIKELQYQLSLYQQMEEKKDQPINQELEKFKNQILQILFEKQKKITKMSEKEILNKIVEIKKNKEYLANRILHYSSSIPNPETPNPERAKKIQNATFIHDSNSSISYITKLERMIKDPMTHSIVGRSFTDSSSTKISSSSCSSTIFGLASSSVGYFINPKSAKIEILDFGIQYKRESSCKFKVLESTSEYSVYQIDNLLYISGGLQKGKPVTDFIEIDLLKLSFEKLKPLPIPKYAHSMIGLKSKKYNNIYSIGGKKDKITSLALCEEYSFESKSWKKISQLNYMRSNSIVSIFELRFIYVIGGLHNEEFVNYIERKTYDSKNAWTIVEVEYPQNWGGIHSAKAIQISTDSILIFGGIQNNEDSSFFEMIVSKKEVKRIGNFSDNLLNSSLTVFKNHIICIGLQWKIHIFSIKSGEWKAQSKENLFLYFNSLE